MELVGGLIRTRSTPELRYLPRCPLWPPPNHTKWSPWIPSVKCPRERSSLISPLWTTVSQQGADPHPRVPQTGNANVCSGESLLHGGSLQLASASRAEGKATGEGTEEGEEQEEE